MIATTIAQSKHLLELGLDPKTADMTIGIDYQDKERLIADKIRNIQRDLEEIGYYDLYDIDYFHVLQPAWSLSALLDVMPMVNEGWPVCCKIYGSEKWHVLYHSTAVTPKIDSGEYDTPIEAAYELVCCLLEQGLIKKGDSDERGRNDTKLD